MNAQLTFVHALSPLHAGIGRGAGVIDLPIAREKATGLPFLPGSSLKGALRTRCFNDTRLEQTGRQIFGDKDAESGDSRASQVQLSDQHLLLLPIRSLAGTFAWVTSPYVLRRLVRDSEETAVKLPTKEIPAVAAERCVVASTSTILLPDRQNIPTVYLEDLDLPADENAVAKQWAQWIGERVFPQDKEWQEMLLQRFCLVHDNIFHFLLQTAIEITARIKMNEDSKTVEEGGLWYEEALPTETILSGLLLATPLKKSEISVSQIFDMLQGLTGQTIQLGGKATVGRGLCRVQLTREEI